MKHTRSLCTLILLLLAAAGALRAQENPNVAWKLLTPTLTGKPGDVVEVKVEAKIASGWKMYSTKGYPDSLLAAPQATEITVGESSLLTRSGSIKGTRPERHYDEGFETETEYWKGTATLTIPVKISKKATTGQEAKGWVNFYFQTCDASVCLPPVDKKLTFTVQVMGDSATASTDTAGTGQLLAAADSTANGADTNTLEEAAPRTDTAAAGSVATGPGAGKEEKLTGSAEDIERAKEEGLMAFLGLAVLMGLGALVTPCVFPMIPITVSFFTKRPQTTRARSVRDAGLYSLGIILTFTALGLVVTLLMGATGVNDFATNPVINIIIAGVFLLLALNLFGMFEIQVPTSILNRLNKKAEGDSVAGVILMGLVFSLTSFTCTVPFVGTLFNLASKGEYLWPILGTAAFATVFSAPFFLLALFPAVMKSLPKSGGWLNAVKVVMGFIEVAAAIKFISNADLVLQWGFLTRELFLAIWIAVAVLITLYLLGHFQLPHDTRVEKVGPLRVLFAISFLAVGFWLLTGLFGGRLGELDAQLPPPDYSNGGGAMVAARAPGAGAGGSPDDNAKKREEWLKNDYEAALEISRSSGKPIFIDFTGYTCTNCRWMETNMFSRKEIADLMNKYVLVRLYTDGRDPISKKYKEMQYSRFNKITLPYYVLINSSDSTMAQFEGMTRDANQFVTFLEKGLTSGQMALKD